MFVSLSRSFWVTVELRREVVVKIVRVSKIQEVASEVLERLFIELGQVWYVCGNVAGAWCRVHNLIFVISTAEPPKREVIKLAVCTA